MKVSITFHDLSGEAAFYLVKWSLGAIQPETAEKAEPSRRKRRTKAEMDKARAQAEASEEGPPSQGPLDPPTPRRRKSRSEALPVDEHEKPARRKRKKKEDDGISDADVAKAASEGAQKLTPKVVSEILEEFGVGNVAELDQAQRREFMDILVAEKIPF